MDAWAFIPAVYLLCVPRIRYLFPSPFAFIFLLPNVGWAQTAIVNLDTVSDLLAKINASLSGLKVSAFRHWLVSESWAHISL